YQLPSLGFIQLQNVICGPPHAKPIAHGQWELANIRQGVVAYLPRRQWDEAGGFRCRGVAAIREQKFARLPSGPWVCCPVCSVSSNRGLLLADRCSIERVAVSGHIIDAHPITRSPRRRIQFGHVACDDSRHVLFENPSTRRGAVRQEPRRRSLGKAQPRWG